MVLGQPFSPICKAFRVKYLGCIHDYLASVGSNPTVHVEKSSLRPIDVVACLIPCFRTHGTSMSIDSQWLPEVISILLYLFIICKCIQASSVFVHMFEILTTFPNVKGRYWVDLSILDLFFNLQIRTKHTRKILCAPIRRINIWGIMNKYRISSHHPKLRTDFHSQCIAIPHTL